jgi:hypothetical protein
MKLIIALLTTALLLAACGPAPTPEPAALSPTAAPPTPIPPTDIPTEPPASPTPVPAEALASSMDDLLGVWWFPRGPMKMELKQDGTYRVWDQYSGTQAEGNFTLNSGNITWVTSHPTCNDVPATYAAYVTTQDGKPVQLRLVLVGTDPCKPRVENSGGIGKYLNP